MGKTKASASKKQKAIQKRGVDFKKIKRKLGRKLPPPKNETNTVIKSKAIVLPEQSLASDKAGLAVSKKGLTLKELLQQTAHHNARVRKDALLGMKDLFSMHPNELKEHRYAVMEKLRERFSDDDKVVRDTLYQLLKSVVLPGCKEDNQGALVSLMVAYIFNAMTNLALEVRLMAFKFLEIFVQYHPPSFFLHAEKILQHYEDILQRNQLLLQEKVKLKSTLSGLVRCLSLLTHNEGDMNTSEMDAPERKLLHAYKLDDSMQSSADSSITIEKIRSLLPILLNCFKEFPAVTHGALSLDAQSFDSIRSTLQSINLAVQFLIHESLKGNSEFDRLNGRHETYMRCHSIALLLLKRLLGIFPLGTQLVSEKDDEKYFILNIGITEIFLHIMEWVYPPVGTVKNEKLLEHIEDVKKKFFVFIENVMLGNAKCGDMGSRTAFQDKHNLVLISYIPKLVWQEVGGWKFRLVKAFTYTFQNCCPESSMKLACLKAIEEMFFSREDLLSRDVDNPELLDYYVTWIRMLPELLVLVGNKVQSVSKLILDLLLRLGQQCAVNPVLEREYEILQYSLQQFYCTHQVDGICYGPFIKLPTDSQVLSVSCLFYFSHLDSSLLTSIASCCLCSELDQPLLSRIIGVMESLFEAGRVGTADYVNFLTTLVCRFSVPQGIGFDFSNRRNFILIIRDICSSLSRMGDSYIVLQMLEKLIQREISSKPPLDNACAMLKVLNHLDSAPSKLSNESIITLSSFLSGYLIDVVQCIPLDHYEPIDSVNARARRYYILPCHILFVRSDKLLNLVLSAMESTMINDTSAGNNTRQGSSHTGKISDVVSALLLLHRDDKVKKFGDISGRLHSLKERARLSL